MNQKELIIDFINRFGSITPLQAVYELGITKLATRVSELRRDGVAVKDVDVKTKNRYGKAIQYKKYFLEEERLYGESNRNNG